jgi:hypothetical protein
VTVGVAVALNSGCYSVKQCSTVLTPGSFSWTKVCALAIPDPPPLSPGTSSVGDRAEKSFTTCQSFMCKTMFCGSFDALPVLQIFLENGITFQPLSKYTAFKLL